MKAAGREGEHSSGGLCEIALKQGGSHPQRQQTKAVSSGINYEHHKHINREIIHQLEFEKKKKEKKVLSKFIQGQAKD